MDELTIGDKTYISSKKAAQITGYAKDYVGQLCREGHVEARMVGRNWYVLETSIRAHRFGAPATPVEEEVMPVKEPAPVMEKTEEIKAPVAPAAEPLTWSAPVYAAEAPAVLPEITPRRSINILDSDQDDDSDQPESVRQMQNAWREWFETRKGETFLESPEVIDAREEEQTQEAAVAPQTAQEIPHAEEPQPRPYVPVLAPEHVYKPAHEEAADELEEGAEMVAIHKQKPQVHVAPERLAKREVAKEEGRVLTERRVRPKKVRTANTSGGPSTLIIRTVLIVIVLIAIAATAIGTGYAERYVPSVGSNNIVAQYLGGTRIVEKNQ